MTSGGGRRWAEGGRAAAADIQDAGATGRRGQCAATVAGRRAGDREDEDEGAVVANVVLVVDVLVLAEENKDVIKTHCERGGFFICGLDPQRFL